MATRNALRFVSRRFSGSGKVLGKEEQAAENVYIKKMEQEKLEKLARKGPTAEEQSAAGLRGSDSVTDAKPGVKASSSTPGVSNDNYRNYGVLAGIIAGAGALGWYLMSKEDKKVDVQD